MLRSLRITNYVIIQDSEIPFSPGLNMITGETGAGKSILLGALGLILGRRADLQVLLDNTTKAVVEAAFVDAELRTTDLLKSYDLDAGTEIVMRREITPSGRSRAFVNDTPVTLETMAEIGGALMDIHQQFETLEIQQAKQQYQMLDAYCGSQSLVREYQDTHASFTKLQTTLATLRQQQAAAEKEKDYLNFQLSELSALHLNPGDLPTLEEEFTLQSGAEELKVVLAAIAEVLSGEQSMTDALRIQLRALTRHVAGNGPLRELAQKLETIMDECSEVSRDAFDFADRIDPDSQRRTQLEEKLNAINKVMLKHGARNEEELFEVQEQLDTRLQSWTTLDAEIASHEKEVDRLSATLHGLAIQISKARKKGAPKLAQSVSKGLQNLAMKHATLHIEVGDAPQLHFYGADNVEFLFAPNLGSQPKPVKKVASGGELSRLNLCLKSAVSDKMQLPTLVFDEIDAGVSGEVAVRMGNALRSLAQQHQVIMITHSPQIAAQAGHHLQVEKSDVRGKSIATIRALVPEERITEIAKMLSGDPPTKAAILNAKTLIET